MSVALYHREQCVAKEGSKAFGDWLKSRRESLGYSVRGLAAKAGVSHATISKLEDAKVGATPSMLLKIKEGLGVSYRYILNKHTECLLADHGELPSPEDDGYGHKRLVQFTPDGHRFELYSEDEDPSPLPDETLELFDVGVRLSKKAEQAQ